MTGVSLGQFEMDTREIITVTFDVSAWLYQGATIVAGTPELVRISDGQNYSSGLRGAPQVVGQTIAQQLDVLEVGERYFLILPFTSGGQTFAPRLQITCPSP